MTNPALIQSTPSLVAVLLLGALTFAMAGPGNASDCSEGSSLVLKGSIEKAERAFHDENIMSLWVAGESTPCLVLRVDIAAEDAPADCVAGGKFEAEGTLCTFMMGAPCLSVTRISCRR